MTQLRLSEAIDVITKLDQFIEQIHSSHFGFRLLKGWLKELKTNVLQRSVNYAYAMDIDLIHYGFRKNREPVAVAIHELKWGKRRIENNKSKLQFQIAEMIGVPFYFTQVLDPNQFIVRKITETGCGKPNSLDYGEWDQWQRNMSRKHIAVLPGEDSDSNLSQIY